MATLDVAAFQPVTGGQSSHALFAAGNPGTTLTGAAKLSQRFTMELLTSPGSMTYLPARGTNWATLISGNRLFSEFDAFAAFAEAVIQAGINLQEEETDDDPDDERFASAELTQLSLEPGQIVATIRIHNLANQSNVVTLPVTITPREIGV